MLLAVSDANGIIVALIGVFGGCLSAAITGWFVTRKKREDPAAGKTKRLIIVMFLSLLIVMVSGTLVLAQTRGVLERVEEASGRADGLAVRLDVVEKKLADVGHNAPPIAKKLRDAFVVSFVIDYHYPEEHQGPIRSLLASRWNDVFFGRQPPMFLSRSTGQPKLITPPRAVHDPEHGRVSEGQVIFVPRYEPKSGHFELEGHGSYRDWLDTGEEDPSAPNPQDSRYIPFTWGIKVSFVDRPAKGELRDGSAVTLDFMLSGAGAETHFTGRATLSAEKWIKEQKIELYFVRSDRFTEAENEQLRNNLQMLSISLATMRIDSSESKTRRLASDEWWQGFEITQEP